MEMTLRRITNLTVVTAYTLAQARGLAVYPSAILQQWTGQPQPVCVEAMQAAVTAGLVAYDVALELGWVTERGRALFELAAASAEGQA
jgi:hypothetical protein